MNNIMVIDGYRAVIQYDPDLEVFRGEFTAEEILSMDDDEFMAMWEEWESRDTLALQENLNSKEEWLP